MKFNVCSILSSYWPIIYFIILFAPPSDFSGKFLSLLIDISKKFQKILNWIIFDANLFKPLKIVETKRSNDQQNWHKTKKTFQFFAFCEVLFVNFMSWAIYQAIWKLNLWFISLFLWAEYSRATNGN